MRTLLHGGDVVAFADGGHRLVRGGALVLDGDRVGFVGREFKGTVDQRVDVSGRLVIPGLVNLHCHADTEAGGRLVADAGRRDYFQAGYLNYFAAPRGTRPMGVRADRTRGARFALVELLKSGCTTVVPIGPADDEMIDTIGAVGLRAYVSPMYKSGSYVLDGDGALTYDWNEEEGRQGLERAKDFIRKHQGAHGDRVRGMLFPMQIDTCSPALLRASRQAADELGVGIEIHAGQNLLEFHEILRRHCMTPVELLEDTGVLGPDAIIGHCIISTAHHLAALPAGRDLEILVRTGTTVAHCPLVFARRGNALESFHRFRAAGVNVGLGTDTYPRDLISEMRWATLISKIVEHDFTVATAGDALTAATLAGAKALRRDDLGRLAPGAKADVVVVNLQKIRIGPYRDPIKALVNCATMDDVERVFVDGRLVVDGGRVVGVDEVALLREAQAESERLWQTVPEWHWEKKTADEMSPPALPSLDRDLT